KGVSSRRRAGPAPRSWRRDPPIAGEAGRSGRSEASRAVVDRSGKPTICDAPEGGGGFGRVSRSRHKGTGGAAQGHVVRGGAAADSAAAREIGRFSDRPGRLARGAGRGSAGTDRHARGA